MPYTTQGYMTAADMADMVDLYDLDVCYEGRSADDWGCPCCESGQGAAMDPAGPQKQCEMCGHEPGAHA